MVAARLCLLAACLVAAAASANAGVSVIPSVAFGSPASFNQFPSYVYLETSLPDGNVTYCSGTLVSPTTVLTAGAPRPAAATARCPPVLRMPALLLHPAFTPQLLFHSFFFQRIV